MKIKVRVENTIPTKHQYVVLRPSIEIEDDLHPNETPAEARTRLSTIANALFAREVMDQLGYADRRVEITPDVWCREFLSSIGGDHPVLVENADAVSIPPGVREAFGTLGKLFGESAYQEFLDKAKAAEAAKGAGAPAVVSGGNQ